MKHLTAVMLLSSAVMIAQQPAGTRSAVDVEAEQKKMDAAETLIRGGKFPDAENALQEILKDQPKNARVAYDLGLTEEQLKKLPEAEASYRTAMAADSRQFEARFALGLLLARAGKVMEARELLASAVELTSSTGEGAKADAYRALAQVDFNSRPEDAKAELKKAVALSAETAEDKEMLARLEAGQATPQDSEAAYREQLKTTPGDSVASANLATLLVRQKRSAEAVPVLQAAIETHPNEVPLQRMQADVYLEMGDYASATPLLQKLSAEPNADPVLLDDYGNALIRQNRTTEAQQVLQKALSGSTPFPTKEARAQAAAHLAFAASANQDGVTTLSALAIRDAVEPPTASSLFLAATAHDRLHHTKLAVEAYHQFLKASGGKFPNEEWEAKHRLIALEKAK